jgi:hypothetical protein
MMKDDNKGMKMQNFKNEVGTGQSLGYDDKVRNLNAKILALTMSIKDKQPELSKYIEEMPITIPDEKFPEVTLQRLQKYYDSLYILWLKYEEQQAVDPHV